MGGKLHLKLNICLRPIANKYHEGKMKRTLKRELKVPEIAEREANETSVTWRDCCVPSVTPATSTQVWLQVWIRTRVVLLALSVTVSSRTRKTIGTR